MPLLTVVLSINLLLPLSTFCVPFLSKPYILGHDMPIMFLGSLHSVGVLGAILAGVSLSTSCFVSSLPGGQGRFESLMPAICYPGAVFLLRRERCLLRLLPSAS